MRKEKESFILIVDDNPKNLQILGNMLEEHHYKTAVAKDGRKALELAQKRLPDVILLDIMMPEMDGFVVCRQLKRDEATREIPVIFISALTETAEKLKGFHVGGVDYIMKPFQKEEVLARVQAHWELRRAHLELQRLNQQLQEANAAKDKFFSIIAHDLRGPLGSLRNITQAVIEHLERYSKDKIIQLLMIQQDAAKNLLTLLENLLTWSRFQRGTIAYSPEHVNVERIVARNITLLTPNAEQKQITLKNSIAEDVPVSADLNMIDTVIRNLISNALKFTHAGGMIDVSTRKDEQYVEIAVADTGIGMSAEALLKLFRIDTKYSQTGTAGEKGTGLGLILCKEFIEKHGGRIRIESEVDKGTTFRFTLRTEPSYAAAAM